jgi:hypothetical protein
MKREPKNNKYLSSLSESYYIIALSLFCFSLCFGFPFLNVLFFAIIFTIGYLIFYADSDFYKSILLKREMDEENLLNQKNEEQKHQELFSSLTEAQRNDYYRLEEIKNSISKNSDNTFIIGSVVEQLEQLLQKYLTLSQKINSNISYFQQLSIDSDIPKLSSKYNSEQLSIWINSLLKKINYSFEKTKSDLEKEQNISTITETSKLLIKQRIEINQKRLTFINNLAASTNLLNQQLLSLVDSFNLINDQVNSSNSDVSTSITEIANQTNNMAETLALMEINNNTNLEETQKIYQ